MPPGGEARAFDAARDVLRDMRFQLERVDARQGLITTRDKPSAGWATPWDTVQTTPAQETSDLLNQQFRRVRITFDDHRRAGQVEVTIFRTQSPGLRLSSKTWRTAAFAIDPALAAQGLGGAYSVPVRRDGYLEARLARAIEQRAASPTPPATR